MSTFDTFLKDNMLVEAFNYGRTSAILPAGRVLFNKNKVTPNHATSKEAGVWGDGKQSVRTYAHHSDKWDKDGKHSVVTKHFHVSSGDHYHPDSPHDKKIGQDEHFHHDQSLRHLPSGRLVGVSNYTDGKKVGHHGEDHSETKAPFHVYK